VWLLRNSGRYKPEQYEVVHKWRGRIALWVEAEQYLSAYSKEELAAALEGRVRLPPREFSVEFGEIALRIPIPQKPWSDLAKPPPLFHVHAEIALPLRDVTKGRDQRFASPYAVVREFCDFLTVATGSYVIADVPEGVAQPGTVGDRPYCPGATPRLPITEEWFRLDRKQEYVNLFERFMGLDWRRHAAFVDAFRCYRLAIGFAPISPSTAYLLLVSAVEAVADAFSAADPSFEDFPDQFRRAFQSWQNDHRVRPEVADSLKTRLLEAQKGLLGASRKFRQVVANYLSPDFWERTPHVGLDPGRLDEHLRAVYDARSKFAHEALEFGIEVETLGVAVLPCYAYDPATRRRRETIQKVLTLDFFAKVTRAVLLAILRADHPALEEEDVDPENWLLGRGILEFPADMVAPTALWVTNNPPGKASG